MCLQEKLCWGRSLVGPGKSIQGETHYILFRVNLFNKMFFCRGKVVGFESNWPNAWPNTTYSAGYLISNRISSRTSDIWLKSDWKPDITPDIRQEVYPASRILAYRISCPCLVLRGLSGYFLILCM